ILARWAVGHNLHIAWIAMRRHGSGGVQHCVKRDVCNLYMDEKRAAIANGQGVAEGPLDDLTCVTNRAEGWNAVRGTRGVGIGYAIPALPGWGQTEGDRGAGIVVAS